MKLHHTWHWYCSTPPPQACPVLYTHTCVFCVYEVFSQEPCFLDDMSAAFISNCSVVFSTDILHNGCGCYCRVMWCVVYGKRNVKNAFYHILKHSLKLFIWIQMYGLNTLFAVCEVHRVYHWLSFVTMKITLF